MSEQKNNDGKSKLDAKKEYNVVATQEISVPVNDETVAEVFINLLSTNGEQKLVPFTVDTLRVVLQRTYQFIGGLTIPKKIGADIEKEKTG
jgi:hypothetical protein